MWIIYSFLSVIFCIIGLLMAFKNNIKAYWASACSFVFVSLTLLMEYKMVFNWVNQEDWSALLDVVPTMFLILSGYVIIILIVNTISIVMMIKNDKL